MVVLVFYLLHCIMSIAHLLGSGMGPHHITFTPLEATMSYTIAQPDILYTEVNYQEWLKANAPSTSTSIEPLAQQESKCRAPTSSCIKRQKSWPIRNNKLEHVFESAIWLS